VGALSFFLLIACVIGIIVLCQREDVADWWPGVDRWLPISILTLGVLLTGALPVPTLAQDIPSAAQQYRRDLTRNARMIWGLDAPVATFAAQIHQESAWRPDARSPYAHGLAQFTPATADWIGDLDPALAVADTGNPVWALRALVRYDAWLYARVPPSRNGCDRMALALRAYNGGLGWLRKEAATGRPCEAFRSAANCRENLGYPQRILTRLEPIYVRAGWGLGSCA
jgi:soluble lytic murein transglycosylase-like protein